MLACYTTEGVGCPITVVAKNDYQQWVQTQAQAIQNFLKLQAFAEQAGDVVMMHDENGALSQVFVCVESPSDLRAVAVLPLKLPEQSYQLQFADAADNVDQAYIYWGLGAYQFRLYKEFDRAAATLIIPDDKRHNIEIIVSGIHLVRDLINTAPQDMSPQALADAASTLADKHNATVTQIVGDDLLTQNYPGIHAVGRASYCPPRLIDLSWGDPSHPKLTLVGKGVCFDTGGLDVKSTQGMALMKKDMGGAAHILGLAQMIMQMNLPVRLRLLIPAVENAVAGNAYHPSDVLRMRNNKTVEISNTDAEGRLVLADALVEACTENPDLLIDFATLTGAARVALGPAVGNMFTHDQALAAELMAIAEKEKDYLWHMPMFAQYFAYLKSTIADMLNSADAPHAGSITAALFLNEFVSQNIQWLHFDVCGWCFDERPGHYRGGDAIGLRTVFQYLCERYR